MLRVGKVKDDLETIEAKFWCNNPHIMLTMMQFCMWQNGQTLAGLVFYGSYFAGMDGSCYYVNRGIPAMILSALVCILTLLHAAFVTVPTFSMVTHMASHKKKKDKLIAAHKTKRGLHRQHTAHMSIEYSSEKKHSATSVVPSDQSADDLESNFSTQPVGQSKIKEKDDVADDSGMSSTTLGSVDDQIAQLQAKLNQLKDIKQRKIPALPSIPPPPPPPSS